MILTETAPTTTIDDSAPASFSKATQPKIWEEATAEAEVNDIIRKPFCPIARVVGKEILPDGCTCLVVSFPNCDDHHIEEWVLPAPATPAPATAPAAPKSASPSIPVPVTLPAKKTAPTAIETDNQPPNRGDGGRGRVQAITKTDKALATIFKDRPKQYQQFLIIREELTAIGCKVGKLIKSRSDVKGWNLSWDGDKAGLYWTTGNGWEIASLTYEAELTGNWEGFDLVEHLDCNGIELPE